MLCFLTSADASSSDVRIPACEATDLDANLDVKTQEVCFVGDFLSALKYMEGRCEAQEVTSADTLSSDVGISVDGETDSDANLQSLVDTI